jgi:hypothetical protein
MAMATAAGRKIIARARGLRSRSRSAHERHGVGLNIGGDIRA